MHPNPYLLVLLLTAILAGCGKPGDSTDTPARAAGKDSAPPPVAPAPASDAQSANQALSCTAQPFAASVDLSEASGATLLADGSIMVVGDSSNHGVFARLAASSGEVLSKGQLKLDSGASDDLEGLSRIGDVLYAITSSGWMRHFRIDAEGFELTVESYPLAPRDKRELVCKSAHDSNCAQNYEGLCLRADASEGEDCAGFAAAKESGKLICLRLGKAGRLQLDSEHVIDVAAPQSLSGCHFDNQGRVWFGTNLFAANNIGFVENPQDLEKLKITHVGPVGLGFGEAIATAEGDQVFRFSDTSGPPSLLSKYICR